MGKRIAGGGGGRHIPTKNNILEQASKILPITSPLVG
jgi:hypothetical protein